MEITVKGGPQSCSEKLPNALVYAKSRAAQAAQLKKFAPKWRDRSKFTSRTI